LRGLKIWAVGLSKQRLSTYENLLKLANVPTSAVRRIFLKLYQVYSMVNGLATFTWYSDQ